MIDVTATMLPSTVMNDGSWDAQIAESATLSDSNSLFIRCARRTVCLAVRAGVLPAVVHLDRVAVGDVANRVVRSGDHLVAPFQPRENLEVLVACDAELDRNELHALALIANDEDAFRFFARFSRLELCGR